MIALRLDAGQDNNGNGRRCYLVLDNKGNTRAVIDAGCVGYGAVKQWAKKHRLTVHDAGSVETTPAEYRELLRHKTAQ